MLTLGAQIKRDQLFSGSCWQLQKGVDGFARSNGPALVTQAAARRNFELIDDLLPGDVYSSKISRVKVRLLEDGYQCWFELSEIMGSAPKSERWQPQLFQMEHSVKCEVHFHHQF